MTMEKENEIAPIFICRDAEELKWEQRRYEIAKEILPALHRSFAGSVDWQCQTAVMYADKLIKELQKPKEQ